MSLGPVPSGFGKAILNYAASGVGKTFLFSTLPHDSTFIIDIDQGLDTLESRGVDIPSFLIESEDRLEKLYWRIKSRSIVADERTGRRTNFGDIRFIGVDGLTELEKLFLDDVTGRKRFARIREFGDTSQLMNRWCRRFRNLRGAGYHVILTALEVPHEVGKDAKGNEIYHVAPMLGKKMARQAPGLFDACARLVIDRRSGDRRLLFESDGSFDAKRRNANIDASEPADLGKLFFKFDNVPEREPRREKAPAMQSGRRNVAPPRQGKNKILDECRAIAADLGIDNVDELLQQQRDPASALTFLQAIQKNMAVLDQPLDQPKQKKG